MVTSSHNAAPQASPAYGVLFLPGLVDGTAQQQDIMLPLTLTYLLSMHVSFYLPVAGEKVATVEGIFDQILSGNSLESKGVVYLASLEAEKLRNLLEKASLVISTEIGLRPEPAFAGLPQALVSSVEGKVQSVRLRNTELIRDPDLKAKLVGCTQLINIQASGFITEGHFSLSW
ncbi:MAG: hypothetical protein AB7O65_13515 [Candidatus Korobacteraceae bacterium]